MMRRASLVLLFFVIVACSSNRSASPLSSNIDALIAAECDAEFRCSPANAKSSYGDVATCNARLSKASHAAYGAPGVSITAAQLDGCTSFLKTTTCNAPSNGSSPCDFKGTESNGAPCVSDLQCQSGSCFGALGPQCGTCTSLVPPGGDCTNADCDQGASCVNQRCAVGGQQGDACDDAAKFCVLSLACVSGHCAPTPPLPGQGAQCDTQRFPSCEVSQSLACVQGTCVAVIFANVGQSCRGDGSVACVDSQCLAASGGTDGVCTAFLAEGAACDATSNAQVACADGLECLNGKCAVNDFSACH